MWFTKLIVFIVRTLRIIVGGLKFDTDQQHVVSLLRVAAPAFPFVIECCHRVLHRRFIYPFNDFAYTLRSELAPLRSTELVGESVGAEVYRIASVELNLRIGKVRLILEDPSSNRELVALHFFHSA